MDNQPIITEQQPNKPKQQQKPNNQSMQVQQLSKDQEVKEQKIQEQMPVEFILPEDIKVQAQQQEKLVYRQRKNRWGDRQISRAKIQEDAVFNPLEALYSGNSLLPITQYGQAELDIKMSLYSDSRKRKSKWHHEIQKTFNPPMLNYISPTISIDEVEYLLRLYRLDQLTSKMNNYYPEDQDVRSPSPEPIYDRNGKRINTRQVRKRDTMIRQRISLIEDCMKMRKSFIPPDDYKPLKKFKKIYLTDSAAKDTKSNYIGKIIGQGGKTQKLIEERSGCKIGVRGRGANKTQKDIFENFEPLHIIIVADTDDSLEKGVDEVQKILNGEEDEELKELLNSYEMQIQGVYEDNYCENCKVEGHRTWACPFKSKNHMMIKCDICGQNTHPTFDCPQKQAYMQKQQTEQIAMLLQSQYSQFKEDVNTKKPQGGTNFITDFEKRPTLSIGYKQQEEQRAAERSGAPKPPVKKPVEENLLNSDLPKFADQ